VYFKNYFETNFHKPTSDLSVPISIKLENKYRYRAANILLLHILRTKAAYYCIYRKPQNLLDKRRFTYSPQCQLNFASLYITTQYLINLHRHYTSCIIDVKQFEMWEAGLGSSGVVFISSLMKILLYKGQRNRRNYCIRLSFVYNKTNKLKQNLF
jgi:hypothetical protein